MVTVADDVVSEYSTARTKSFSPLTVGTLSENSSDFLYKNYPKKE